MTMEAEVRLARLGKKNMRLRIALLSVLVFAISGIVGVTSASASSQTFHLSFQYGPCVVSAQPPAWDHEVGYWGHYSPATVHAVAKISCATTTTVHFWITLIEAQEPHQAFTEYTDTIPAGGSRSYSGGWLPATLPGANGRLFTSWVSAYGLAAYSDVYQLQSNGTLQFFSVSREPSIFPIIPWTS